MLREHLDNTKLGQRPSRLLMMMMAFANELYRSLFPFLL